MSWLLGSDMRCFQDLLGSKIFPNSFQKELTSWRSILVWKEGLALVLAWPWFYACLLNLTPQVRLWGWLLGPLCVPLCSFVVRGQRRRGTLYLGRSIVNAIGRGKCRAWGESSLVTKRAFLYLHPPLSLGLSRMGDLGLPRSSSPVWLHRIRMWVFLCVWQNVNRDGNRQLGKLGLKQERSKQSLLLTLVLPSISWKHTSRGMD